MVGDNNFLYHLLITVGLLGLIASFHGIILAAGRATFEFGRIRYITPRLGRVHHRFKTPANALVINMLVGIIALLTGKTGEIITIACFGALSLYIVSMVSLFVLRRREPELERPFRVPLVPPVSGGGAGHCLGGLGRDDGIQPDGSTGILWHSSRSLRVLLLLCEAQTRSRPLTVR